MGERAATTVSMHTNIFPTFTIKDKAAAQPLLDKCVEDTKAEAGCLYYGWTVKEDGSKLFCRETYVDGAAAGEHLSCVAASGALGEALEKGYIALDNIDVMGTEADLEAAKKVPEFEAFGCGAWTVWDSFQNFKKTSSEEAATQGFYTIQPTFTLKDKAAADPFMKKCVDLTKNEEGCMYYGWTIKDDKLPRRCPSSRPSAAAPGRSGTRSRTSRRRRPRRRRRRASTRSSPRSRSRTRRRPSPS